MKNLNTYKVGKKVLAAATGVALMFTSIVAAKASQEIKVKNADGKETVITLPDNAVEARIDGEGVTIVILDNSKSNAKEVETVKPETTNNVVNEQTDDKGTELVSQERVVSYMTMSQYEEGVKNAYEYLSQFVNYKHMMSDIQSTYFILNKEYITAELEQQLIDKAYITKTNLTLVGHPGQYDYEPQDPEGWFNFDNAESLKNKLCDYNQKTIHIDYKKDKMDINHLANSSILYFDIHDKEDNNILFNNWFNAYKNGQVNNEYYNESFDQLTALNAGDTTPDIYDSSVGARFMTWFQNGEDVMQMMRDYFDANYSRKELSEYFVKSSLNSEQWFLRDDITLSNRPEVGLETLVAQYGQLDYVVHQIVYNDISNLFGQKCVTPEELNTKSR